MGGANGPAGGNSPDLVSALRARGNGLIVVLTQHPLRLGFTSHDFSLAAHATDHFLPAELLGAGASGFCFHLQAQEHAQRAANMLRADRDSLNPDQISGSLGQSSVKRPRLADDNITRLERDRFGAGDALGSTGPASTDVIPEQAQIRALA